MYWIVSYILFVYLIAAVFKELVWIFCFWNLYVG